MQKSQLRFAEAGEPSLLVLHVPPDISKGGQEKLVYALPILSREGGLLLAVPIHTFEDTVLERGQSDDEAEVLGPSFVCGAGLVEEDEEGNIVPVDALPIDLLQVDMLDSVLNRLREYDPALDAGEEIEPFDHEFPGALPTTSQLLNAAREWTPAHGIGRANFYSAREEPEALSPAVKAKGAPKKAAAKRLTTAALSEQVAALAAQVEALAALQTTSRAQLSPSYTPSVAPAVEQPGGQVLGHYPKMAPLSASLAALPPPKHGAPKTAASLLGPPPKTRAQAVESPLPMDEPKDPTAPEATDPVITALAQQSTAITSLVAHLAGGLPTLFQTCSWG